MKKIMIELWIDEEQEAAIEELLPYWQEYVSPEDGRKAFSHYGIEDVARTIMVAGSTHTLWDKIRLEQFRQGLITFDEYSDNCNMTVAARRDSGGETE